MIRPTLLYAAAIFSVSTLVRAQPLTPDVVMREVSHGRGYVIVFLHVGPAPEADSATAMRRQMEHLVHLFTLKREGKLPVFGPFSDAGSLRGIAIANTIDTAEARRWFDDDPHVKAGSLTVEVRPWFGLPGDVLPAGPVKNDR